MHTPQIRKCIMLPALVVAVAGALGACSADTSTDGTSVDHAGTDWQCLPVPDDVMGRILEGEITADGQGVTVEKSVMVEGVDNNFVAADLVFPGDETFTGLFTYDRENIGPITSASKGTATLFNWPETPGGKLDGVDAAEKCLEKK